MSDVYYSHFRGKAQSKLGEYEGQRNESGQRHGSGKATLPNGDIYIGSYHNGKRHGQGTYYFMSCNARYTGNYVHNVKSGQGTMVYPDGSKYEGTWADDEKHNSGIYTYVNNDVYSGDWENGKKSGAGVYKCAKTNVTYNGTWLKGKLHGPCEIIHTNHKYIGSFQDNLPSGKGVYIFDQGYKQLGAYEIHEQRKDMFADEEDIFRTPIWKCYALSECAPLRVAETES